MSKCDLEIALERPDRAYRVGETIAGMVGVSVNADCTCNGLTVTLLWRTHGSGNRAEGGKIGALIYQGEWKAGEKHVHPFEMVLPRGPLPYHGKELNVDWYVVATADIPWAFDPKAEVDLAVSGDGGEAPYDLGPLLAIPDATMQTMEGLGRLIGTVVGVAFAGFGLVGSLVGFLFAGGTLLSGMQETDASALAAELLFSSIFAIFPLIFSGVGVFLLYRMWRNVLAERRLGSVQVDLPREPSRPGGEVPVSIRFEPPREVRIDGVRATLECKEVVVRGSGTNRHTYTHVVHREAIDLTGAFALPGGRPTTFQGQLAIPANAAPSFAAADNELRWAVKLDVLVPGWPDWSREPRIVVQPGL